MISPVIMHRKGTTMIAIARLYLTRVTLSMQVDSSFSSKFKNDCSDKLGIIFFTSGITGVERLAGKFLSVSYTVYTV